MLFGGILLVPAGIGLAVTDAKPPSEVAFSLGFAFVGVLLFSFWLLGRPGDRRDFFEAFLASKPRIAGALYAVVLSGGAAWCAVRMERIVRGAAALETRAISGSVIGLVMVGLCVMPSKTGSE